MAFHKTVRRIEPLSYTSDLEKQERAKSTVETKATRGRERFCEEINCGFQEGLERDNQARLQEHL